MDDYFHERFIRIFNNELKNHLMHCDYQFKFIMVADSPTTGDRFYLFDRTPELMKEVYKFLDSKNKE